MGCQGAVENGGINERVDEKGREPVMIGIAFSAFLSRVVSYPTYDGGGWCAASIFDEGRVGSE